MLHVFPLTIQTALPDILAVETTDTAQELKESINTKMTEGEGVTEAGDDDPETNFLKRRPKLREENNPRF